MFRDESMSIHVCSQEMAINEAVELIHQYCKPGGIVMDLFAGTCVTGLAALRLNRKAILFEIDERCLQAARRRIQRVFKTLSEAGALVTTGAFWRVVPPSHAL